MSRLRLLAGLSCLILVATSGGARSAEILIGQVAPLTGPDATQGRCYAAGLQLYFDKINASGGVNGSRISLAQEDDAGRPEEAVVLATKLLSDPRVLAITGVVGGRNVAALVSSGILKGSGAALVGYRSGDVFPEAPLVYNVRASLGDEIAKIIQHLTTVGIQRIGVFYEDGSGSAAALAAIAQGAAGTGARIVSRASYQPGAVRVRSAVDTFLASQPQVILIAASGTAAAALIEQYQQAGGRAQMYATSSADIEQLGKRLSAEQLRGVSIAQVTPNPYVIRTRLVKEFVDLAERNPEAKSQVSYAMLEGFIAAKVLVHALRQRKPASRSSVVSVLSGMDLLDVGDYQISYRGNSRSGSRKVELSIISAAGKIRQ